MRWLRFPMAHLDWASAFIEAKSPGIFLLFSLFALSPFPIFPPRFFGAEDFISPSPFHCAGRSMRPRSWAARPSRSLFRIPGAGNGAQWRRRRLKISPRARGLAGLGPLVVHLGYLPNLATPDPALYVLSTERLSPGTGTGPGLESRLPGGASRPRAVGGGQLQSGCPGPGPGGLPGAAATPGAPGKYPRVKARNWAGASSTWSASSP